MRRKHTPYQPPKPTRKKRVNLKWLPVVLIATKIIDDMQERRTSCDVDSPPSSPSHS